MASTPRSRRVAADRAGTPRGWFYLVLRILFAPLFLGVFRLRVTGRGNVPATGGLVLASMHRSNFDSIVVGLLFPRPLRFMAKRELYRFAPLAWVLRNAGAFMVDRSATDTAAVEHAISLLRAGEVVAIFPEGTRNRRGASKPRAGAAWIALQAGVPMVPVAISGTDRVRLFPPRLPRFRARYGPPIDTSGLEELDRRRAARHLTDRWSQAVETLRGDLH
jgi:1-acyl-sn-glycerol-3-phosphate acyltransferase